jgi:cytoskeletal protein RodZ
MKHVQNYSRRTKIITGILALVLVCFLTVTLLRAWYPTHQKEAVASHQDSVNKKQDTAKTPEQKQPEIPKNTTSTPLPTSSSPACQHFTKSLADQALKATAQLNTDSALTSDTRDLQVSFCTYTAGQTTITLVSYIAKSEVGKSMNSVEFGSGRPAGVQNVTTVGQAAFWNGSLATLSVLKNNNRYTIAITNGSLDQTVDAAKIIIPNV